MNELLYWKLLSLILTIALLLTMVFFRYNVENTVRNIEFINCFEYLYKIELEIPNITTNITNLTIPLNVSP